MKELQFKPKTQKKMKAIHLIAYTLFIFTISSCIRDEAPNAEADIVSCTVPGVTLLTNPMIQNDAVTIFVSPGTEITSLAPEFSLSQGATISPPSGTARNFETPQTYTVTSADLQWHKVYRVSVIDSELKTLYQFEDTLGGYDYYVFIEKENGKTIMQWASGNAGFALTGVPKTPNDYPTLQANEGLKGKCLELVTRSTGSFGSLIKKPIAAGNLFIGQFDVLNALTDPLQATQFGLPFYHVPTYLTGSYKYRSGNTYTEKGKPIDGKRDNCDIYAIFYETDDQVKTLNGTNAFTSPNLISVARIQNAHETDEWTDFNIPFISRPGKYIDKEKLRNGKYNISIVFSSSINGDVFSGAVGSTLLIDEVELLYNSDN